MLRKVRTVSRTGEYGVSPLWATPTTKRRRRLTRRAATSQVPAPAHLKMVTQSKGKKLSDLDGYYYDDTAGRGIRVYVIDTGLDSAHKVCAFAFLFLSFLKREIFSIPSSPYMTSSRILRSIEAECGGAGIRLDRCGVAIRGSFRIHGKIGFG